MNAMEHPVLFKQALFTYLKFFTWITTALNFRIVIRENLDRTIFNDPLIRFAYYGIINYNYFERGCPFSFSDSLINRLADARFFRRDRYSVSSLFPHSFPAGSMSFGSFEKFLTLRIESRWRI